METLQKGSKVYIDGFAGLIAGVITEMVCSMNSDLRTSSGEPLVHYPTSARVKVTARTGRGYMRGEEVVRPVSMVVPRKSVRFRKYGTRILGYNVLV